MQVDWISAFCEARAWPGIGYAPYDTGRVLLVGPNGELQRQSSGKVLVEGSHDSRLLVRSATGADLYLSGNPVKFIQGHNLFGPVDPCGLFFDAGWEVRKAVGCFPSAATWESGEFEGPRFTRLDLTRSFRFPTAGDARCWLRDSAAAARSRHKGGVVSDGTVYFGKGSERWTFKAYHKGDEVLARGKDHRLAEDLPHKTRLVEWAQGVVRFELTLRAKELEKLQYGEVVAVRGAQEASGAAIWRGAATLIPLRLDVRAARALWQQYFDKITWNRNAQSAESDMLEVSLPLYLQGTLAMWRQGRDLRQVMSKTSFYRQRQELLAQCGVDIASPPPARGVVPAPTEARAVGLDPAGWDPEPIEGYAWRSPRQGDLVG